MMKVKRMLVTVLSLLLCFTLFGCAGDETEQQEVKLKNIQLNKSEIIMGVGETFQLTVNLDPVDATKGRTITVTSENSDKASINKDLLVTANEVGETKIVITSSYGGITANLKIIIVPKLETGLDLIIALRGEGEKIYLTNDVLVTNEQLALVQYTALTIKRSKTIFGQNFKLDLSAITINSDTPVLDIATDDPVVFENVNIVVPSSFASDLSCAIGDPNGVFTKTDCTVTAKL